MAIRISCPSCQHTAAVDDSYRGKRIRCPQCQEPFTAGAAGAGSPAQPKSRPDERVRGQSSAPPRRPRDEDEGEDEVAERRSPRRDEEAPRRGGSRVRAAEDDPAPRRRPTRREEDLDDERPVRRKAVQSGGPSPAFLLGLGGLGLLVVALAAGGLVFALSGSGKQNQGADNAPIDGQPVNALVGGQPLAAQPANNPPEPEKKPEKRPLPASIGPEDLKRVKQATVYLRVALPNGSVAEGTGFFAQQSGVIVTNAHVLGMLTPQSVAPKSVQVVVHSGEPNELKLGGVVLGVDRVNDLAILRADATGGQLPQPLALDSAANLIETQKVFVFGFPLGARLGKNITVSESSVTSLRRNAAGIQQVQVNGGMHPGNSGGPVTDSRGNVVGVSVSVILGTQLNFAIPAEFVTRVFAGSTTDYDFGVAYASGGATHLPVRVKTLDPLQKIREVKLDVWTAPAGGTPAATDKQPEARPGDGARQRVAAAAREGGYAAEVALPHLPAGQVYYVQPLAVDADGKTHWSEGRAVPFDPEMVVERKAAQLEFKRPTGPVERTLEMRNNASAKLFTSDKSRTFSSKMEGHVLESLSPDPQGAAVRLTLAQPRFTRERDSEVTELPPALGSTVANYSPTFVVSPVNRALSFTRPNFREISPLYREQIGDLFETVCNTYEVTLLPLPNRSMRPQETWPAKVPMSLIIGKKKEVRYLHLNCSYEGVRTAPGRNEGYVRISGVVKGSGRQANTELGKVGGHALVNLDTGLLSQVKINRSYEIDTGESDFRMLITEESTVDRVAGNTHNITPKPVAKSPSPPSSTSTPPADGPVPAGWTAYTSKFKTFTIWLPDSGRQSEQSKTIPLRKGSKQQLVMTTVEVAARNGLRMLACSANITPYRPTAGERAADRLNEFQNILKAQSSGVVSGEKEINQGRAPGKEFRMNSRGVISRWRIYSFGSRLYYVAVSGTAAQVASADANTFLNSYRLPDSVVERKEQKK